MSDIVLDTWASQVRGVIGRYPEEGERYVFEYRSLAPRSVHMLFVRGPLKVTWFLDGEVVREETLEPWTGFGVARADRVVEERPDGRENF